MQSDSLKKDRMIYQLAPTTGLPEKLGILPTGWEYFNLQMNFLLMLH
ncbi:hypothetical protein NIES2100_29680 [Calothrix sp. NIES-2100]|nr:hypothetical protein NIES2100_29680 [Calothrix sp. NIES-2100]